MHSLDVYLKLLSFAIVSLCTFRKTLEIASLTINKAYMWRFPINTEHRMSHFRHLHFNEKSDYSEEMKSFIPPFSTIERNCIYWHFSCQFITYSIRIGNLNWCKCGHCKNEVREIDCLCCREVEVMLIASTKVSEREGSILPSNFYGHLPGY